jgi:hypothetical protein
MSQFSIGLAGAVRPEEAGDPAGPDFETQAVNGGDSAVPLGEVVNVEHVGCPFEPGGDARGWVPN